MRKSYICGCVLATIGTLVLTTGCSRYRWGLPVRSARWRSVYIPPVKNQAYLAQAQSVLTRQLRSEMAHNGYLVLEDPNLAEAELEVTVTSYTRSIGAVFETDPDTARSLSLSLTVECTFRVMGVDKALFEKHSVSHSQSIEANDFAQAIEYHKMPEITRDVAKKIVMLVHNIEGPGMRPSDEPSSSAGEIVAPNDVDSVH